MKNDNVTDLNTDIPSITIQPTTFQEVEEWLGFSHRYSEKIGNYQLMAAPLQLLSSYGPANAEFPWTRRLNRIFATLQRATLLAYLTEQGEKGELSRMLAQADIAVLQDDQQLRETIRLRLAYRDLSANQTIPKATPRFFGQMKEWWWHDTWSAIEEAAE